MDPTVLRLGLEVSYTGTNVPYHSGYRPLTVSSRKKSDEQKFEVPYARHFPKKRPLIHRFPFKGVIIPTVS